MKIGVISDTHIPKRGKKIPEIVLKSFHGIDHIIHAGDIMSVHVVEQLEEIAPVTAVCGNVDPPGLVEKLGHKKIQTFGNLHFGVFHGHGTKGKTLDRAIKCFEHAPVDCIIFGHSHVPYCEFHGDTLLFNPGSPTDKRRNKYYSFGLIEIHEKISPQLVYFDAEGIIQH